MNGGRQSSALLPPLLVVWVVHLIKKSLRLITCNGKALQL